MRDVLESLNPSQLEAITTIEGPLLVLAGAGSGKTKTITTRLAYLIDCVGIPPSNTLTLTFTNKAAIEMQGRALAMMQHTTLHPPLLCTFHRFGLLFLKFYGTHLGRKPNFILADSEDTKRIVKELNGDLAPLPLVLSEISRYKNSQISPEKALKEARNETYKHLARVYGRYQDFLLQKNLVDFDDLLLLPLEILQKNPEVAREVSEKYQYIMVDEYQDTNYLQYLLLKCLCCAHQNLCVVGDDDQSIYSWRGANIQNILQFSEHFRGAKVIKLQENYRSTQRILQAANALIAHNKERLGKTLVSTLGEGKKIAVLCANDEKEETQRIAAIIRKLLDLGVRAGEIAVLFRLNALSRSLEEGFNRAGIPYVLVGAVRFYARSEIKDVLSYFRMLVNLEDDFSLARIINKPRRGIGKTTLQRLLDCAQEQNSSVYGLVIRDAAILRETIGKKAYESLEEFFTTMSHLQEVFRESSLRFIDVFEEKIGFCEALHQSNDAIDRVSNVEEFYGVYREYVKQNPLMELEDFLNDLALRSDQEDVQMRQGDGVSCMSVHSSKGLEFDYVFVIGLEEGFFPLAREDSNLQEERRLGYVALTRAKKELFLSHVHSRFYRGNRTTLLPSRFLRESGVYEEDIQMVEDSGFKKGDCVMHKLFGAGRVLEVSQMARVSKLKINFGGLVREILASYVTKV